MTATLTGTAISRRRRDATLVKNGQRHAVHARTASAAEKAELWPKIVASASRLMRAANSKPRSVSLGKTAKLIRYAGSPGISERRARGRCGEPGVFQPIRVGAGGRFGGRRLYLRGPGGGGATLTDPSPTP